MRLNTIAYAVAITFALSFVLFYATPGLLGPYAQPNDTYHFLILWLTMLMVGLLFLLLRRRR